MSQQFSSDSVWSVLGKEIFGVLGMVNAKGQARTVGIVYVVYQNKLYVATGKKSWKARHVRRNHNVSMTIPIAKNIPFLPWIKIPAATITFSGVAEVYDAEIFDPSVLHALFRGKESDTEMLKEMCVIEIQPVGDFVTYGVGIRLTEMMDQEKARGRAPVIRPLTSELES